MEPEVKCVLPDWYAAELGPHTILFKEGDAVGNFKRLLGSVKDLTPMEVRVKSSRCKHMHLI